MPYVLRRNKPFANGHSAYVAHKGLHKAYVTLPKARRFKTRGEAMIEACGNEIVEWTDE